MVGIRNGKIVNPEPNCLKSDSGSNSAVDRLVSINCDQVAWLLDIAERYIPHDSFPRISRQREMKKYGMLYEIMEIIGARFEDDRARWNGTPNEARGHEEEC